MVKSVKFISRREAENSPGMPEWAMISITENAADRADLHGWRDVLRLAFHDIDVIDTSGEYTLMSADQAHQIVDFIDRLAPEIAGVMVHCNAGISRSAAVARWIAGRYSLPFNWQYTLYNKYVYRLLVTAGAARDTIAEVGNQLALQEFDGESDHGSGI